MFLSIAGSPMEAVTLTEVASSRLPDFLVTQHYFKIYMSRPLKRQNPVFNFFVTLWNAKIIGPVRDLQGC